MNSCNENQRVMMSLKYICKNRHDIQKQASFLAKNMLQPEQSVHYINELRLQR